MSASGAYRPPKVAVHTYPVERRDAHPLNQLGRSLNELCLEASDSFEIAAHLEALGYNSDDVPARYGVRDHFELAQHLFVTTPKLLPLERPVSRVRQNVLKQVILVLTLLVAAGIGLFTQVNAYGAVFWLLVWSQLGGALLNRAKSELGAPQQRRVTSLVLELGLVGMVLTWFVAPFALATWTVSLLWIGVAGLVWDERFSYACALPLAAALLLGLHQWAGLEFTYMLAGTGLATLVALRPLLVWAAPATWRWAAQQLGYLLPFALYGVGQGLLLLALLGGAHSEALPGVVLFAVLLLVAEAQLLHLRAKLTTYLWEESSGSRYDALTRQAVLEYVGRYLVAFLPALALWLLFGLHPSLFYLVGFALFGVALALGLVFLSLGDSTVPAAVFGIGGVAVGLGFPFLLGLPVMVLVMLVLLLRRCHNLGRHGIHLL